MEEKGGMKTNHRGYS